MAVNRTGFEGKIQNLGPICGDIAGANFDKFNGGLSVVANVLEQQAPTAQMDFSAQMGGPKV